MKMLLVNLMLTLSMISHTKKAAARAVAIFSKFGAAFPRANAPTVTLNNT
jgi:hypothetical protein